MPIKSAKPTLDLATKTILLYGPPKIGKSTFASQFPGAVFVATEPGLGNLTTLRWERADGGYVTRDWVELAAATKEVAASPDVQTIVIDIIDHAYFFADKAVCEKHGVDFRLDGVLGYGKGSAMIDSTFKSYIKALTSCGKGVVFISHAKAVEKENAPRIIVPSIPEKARPLVMGEVDMILYATTESVMIDGKPTVQRVLKCRPHPSYEAGGRVDFGVDAMALDYATFRATYERATGAAAKGGK